MWQILDKGGSRVTVDVEGCAIIESNKLASDLWAARHVATDRACGLEFLRKCGADSGLRPVLPRPGSVAVPATLTLPFQLLSRA